MLRTNLMAVAVVLSLAACGSGTETSAVIGSAGGSLSTDNVTLDIPQGALSKDVQITLREDRAGADLRVGIEPRDLKLARKARLKVKVDSTSQDGAQRVVKIEGEVEVELEYETHRSGGDSSASSSADSSSADAGVEVEVEIEVEIEDGGDVQVSGACEPGFELEDGACKPHGGDSGSGGSSGADDSSGGSANDPGTGGCPTGFELEDGACKPHGG